VNPFDSTPDEGFVPMKKKLQVMKFGGTSVGDACCIGRVVEIIRQAKRESDVAVVVSAMRGVTNLLIEAANDAKIGNKTAVDNVFTELKNRHLRVVAELVHSADEQSRLRRKLYDLFALGERLCAQITVTHEVTPRNLDAISGLGERLSAPLVAVALAESGVASEAIEATELVGTDSYHGGAEPRIDVTRARCQVRLAPILRSGVVPVVTGFIGATEEGVLTTLGRGGSDYSATILGAAIDADEVVIWSDVNGLLSADPRLVPDSLTIPEISYREAAELAYFGAKVLHPKTLHPVMQVGIPVWIRNTFDPNGPATQITPSSSAIAGIKALTAISDATLITIAGPRIQGIPDALARTVATAVAVRADILLISQSSSRNDISVVVPSSLSERTVLALRKEFSLALAHEEAEHNVFTSAVSVITLVGQGVEQASDRVGRISAAFARHNINIIATALASSECSMSFVIPQQSLKGILANLHRDLELAGRYSSQRPASSIGNAVVVWAYQSGTASAD
jgi:aspartokinase/homoserine dehydrogenase 1